MEDVYKEELSSGIIYKTLKDDFTKYMSRCKDRELLEQILTFILAVPKKWKD